MRGFKVALAIMFVVGCLILCFAVYGAYYLFTVELPSGVYTRLPLAVIGGIFFGLLLIYQSYPIFIPLEQDSYTETVICSHCGALVEEDAEVCKKCNQKIDKETTSLGNLHDE
ncbi:MAG: zinc ribbon domain-containing protein [Methanocella sp.]|jgi:ribosomal protein L40E